MEPSVIAVASTGPTPDNGGRIPKTLQAVFLASNRGNEVYKPPPKQVAFKTFFRSIMGKSKKGEGKANETKKTKAEKEQAKKDASYKKKSADPTKPPRPKVEKKFDNPQDYLDHLMKSRGYATKRYSTLKTAYHNKPTALQKASYDLHLIGVIKSGESDDLNEILKAGISPNPCNTYGESLVHMVCRRGDYKLLQVFIQNGCDLQVADDYGRTPLHDACWAAEPAFDMVRMLLDQDLTLLQMTDCRGFLPLSYVRKEHWPAWIQFIESNKDAYFPSLLLAMEQSMHSTVSTVCEFVDQSPDTRPIQDPLNALPLDLANMVASGAIKPEEAMYLRDRRMAKNTKKGEDSEEDEDDDEDSEYDSDDDDDSDYDSDDEDFNDEEFKNLIGNLTLRLESPRPSMSHGTIPADIKQ